MFEKGVVQNGGSLLYVNFVFLQQKNQSVSLDENER